MFHGLPLQINYAPTAAPTTPLPPPSSAAASYGLRPKPISHGAVSDRFEMASYCAFPESPRLFPPGGLKQNQFFFLSGRSSEIPQHLLQLLLQHLQREVLVGDGIVLLDHGLHRIRIFQQTASLFYFFIVNKAVQFNKLKS